MTVLRLMLEYDGTDFHGWQMQPTVRTVEGALRTAIERVTSESPVLNAAGRTDAGAHAHGQVVGLTLQREWSPDRLSNALNAVLPSDVSIRETSPAQEGFHARHDALERTYRYVVVSRAARAPLLRRYAWQVADPLDLDAMRQGARLLKGKHDFGAFGRSPRKGGGTVRTITSIELRRISVLQDTRATAHVIEVTADAFLYGMMRGIAGALVAVGRSRMEAVDVAELLARPQRQGSVSVAPARGLHQWAVTYPVAQPRPVRAPETRT